MHVCFGLEWTISATIARRDERFSETGMVGRLTKKSLHKNTFTDSRCSRRLSDSSNCFSRLQTLISTELPWYPPYLFCVSGIHQKSNYGFTRSTPPITAHERTAICKSQLQANIEKPGNTRGGGSEQAFGRWFADGLYRGLVSSVTQATCRFALSYYDNRTHLEITLHGAERADNVNLNRV